MSWSGTTYRKGQVPSDQEDRILELESIVHIVVVDDDRAGDCDPDRDDDRRRELGFGLWRLSGDGGRQLGVVALLDLEELRRLRGLAVFVCRHSGRKKQKERTSERERLG